MNPPRMSNAPAGTEAKGKTNQLSGKGSVAQRSFVIRWRDEIRDCCCLNSSQKLVAYTVASHMGASGAGWPATPTIATEASLGQRTTEGALLRLEKFGFLTIKRTPGCVNRYQAAIPTPAVVARVARELGIEKTPADNDLTPATVAVTPAVAAGEIVKQVVTTNRTTTSREEVLEARDFLRPYFLSLRLGLHLALLRSSERSDQFLLGPPLRPAWEPYIAKVVHDSDEKGVYTTKKILSSEEEERFYAEGFSVYRVRGLKPDELVAA